MAITKKDLRELKQEIKRHNDVLYEKFRDDIKTIGEGWQAVAKKNEATFEMVGEMKEDVEIMKSDIAFIKQNLGQKVDRDEFGALEKRVLFLESKVKRA